MPTGDDAAMGLRERKKQQTRDAISLATIGLSLERGWDNVTVDDIAAAANVSPRTFRNYFSSKAEAVAALHLRRMRRISDELRARPATEPLWEALPQAVLPPFVEADAAGGSDPQRTDRLWQVLSDPAVLGEALRANVTAEAELAAAIAERTGTDPTNDIYPKLVAATVSAAITTVIGHCLRADPPPPLGPPLRDALDRLRTGLPVP